MAGKQYDSTRFEFDSVKEFNGIVTQLEQQYKARKLNSDDAKVLCMVDDGEEWLEDYDRSPLVVYHEGEPVNAAAVSKHNKYYEPIQFHEPFSALQSAIQDHDLGLAGHITIGKYNKRLTSTIDFEGVQLTDPTSNEVKLGIKIDTAHNGFSAVNVEIGAERLVCSNGLVAWDSKFSLKHEHNDGQFKEVMMYHAVDSILNGVDSVQKRFEKAHSEQVKNREELFLLLTDCNIEWLFEDPLSAFHEAFDNELQYHDNPEQMKQSPTLYDCYMVGTHAVEHLAKDGVSEQALNTARTRLTKLLEDYNGMVPNGEELVENAVERRTDELQTDGELFDGERELIQQVAAEG